MPQCLDAFEIMIADPTAQEFGRYGEDHGTAALLFQLNPLEPAVEDILSKFFDELFVDLRPVCLKCLARYCRHFRLPTIV
jgi:hypothetical protein